MVLWSLSVVLLQKVVNQWFSQSFVKIATEVDSRGIEGSYTCMWEMQDSEGNNCFPDSRWVFDFTINVTFKI